MPILGVRGFLRPEEPVGVSLAWGTNKLTASTEGGRNQKRKKTEMKPDHVVDKWVHLISTEAAEKVKQHLMCFSKVVQGQGHCCPWHPESSRKAMELPEDAKPQKMSFH